MKEKCLNFINPFLSYIDSGKLFRKPFGWLYIVLAAINAIMPFYLLYAAIDMGLFQYAGAKTIIAFLLIWIFILAACWVGVLIWWKRKDKVEQTSHEGSDFPATPVIAHLIQTSGEWMGAFIAIVGFGISLISLLDGDATAFARMIGLPFNIGIVGIILSPIYGFLTIVGARFTAELCRALTTIAANTKK